MSKQTSSTSIQKLRSRFQKSYGDVKQLVHPKGRPLDVLIQTILSQNTSDTNSMKAYRALRKTYQRWSMILEASQEEVADCIRHGGLAEIKSVRIKNVLSQIKEREGRVSLTHLDRIHDDEALEYLISLPGVGMKTASCVLLFGLDRPIMPVDTHVYRIAGRMGWIDGETKIDDTGSVLQDLIPKKLTYDMHLYLIQHGRQTCRARNPKCAECPIAAFCHAFKGSNGHGLNGHNGSNGHGVNGSNGSNGHGANGQNGANRARSGRQKKA